MVRHFLTLVALCIVCCLAGCQSNYEFAQDDATWRELNESDLVNFSYPEGLEYSLRSHDPLAFIVSDSTGDFSISVMVGQGATDSDYVDQMVAVAIDGGKPIGSAREVIVGRGKGLRQKHRRLDGYKWMTGETTVLASDRGRLVFETSYLERREDELKPIVDRITASLRFDEGTSPRSTTINVSL